MPSTSEPKTLHTGQQTDKRESESIVNTQPLFQQISVSHFALMFVTFLKKNSGTPSSSGWTLSL